MRRFNFLIIISLLGACSPKLHLPHIDMPKEYISPHSQNHAKRISDEWWQVFQSPLLDTLEIIALQNNKDLKMAVSNIESSRYELAIARSEFLPEVEAEIEANAKYQTLEGRDYELAIQPNITWNVSLFGALRHTVGAARAEILASEWAYEGVKLSLTVQVATAYFSILQYRQSLDIARHSLKLRKESAALIDSLSHYGMSTGLDLDQAQSLVYASQSDVEEYRRALDQAKFSLAVLLGKAPEYVTELDWGSALEITSPPTDIPVGLPSDLLARRPDLMESWYELQAAAAKVGIARSNRFPSIALTTDGGLIGSTVKELFTSGYWSWGAAAQLAQPIFSFGRLKRKEQIARVEYEDAVLEYEKSVLTALKEVESSLVGISTYKSQAKQYAEYVDANKRIAELTMALYRNGMNNYLDVISTQQTWYNSQMQLIGLISEQYINYANLVMALGGGWQERD